VTRVSPAPFLRGNVWWARIPVPEGIAIQRPLGVLGEENRDVAVEVCRFLSWLRGRRETYLLDLIASGKAAAGTAYTAYAANRLDAYITELRDGISDVDLEPWVAKWGKEMERRRKPGAATRAKYLRQVRTLLVVGKPFKRSQFTKQRIREWLSSLDIGQPNRHRAALSSFAAYLVFEDVLPSNPVILVPMARESEPRTLHLSQDEARRLLAAFPDGTVYRPLHALMLATGMEFGAAVAVRRQDCEEMTVYAAGTKREHRKRTCSITSTWQWAWEIARQEIDCYSGDERPFRGVSVYQSHRALKAALKVAGLPDAYCQHDHRHTWAVQAIRDGLALHTIAAQLGHRDATMIVKVYGRFRPAASDFNTRSATSGATAPNKTSPKSEASE
jgi:integrase